MKAERSERSERAWRGLRGFLAEVGQLDEPTAFRVLVIAREKLDQHIASLEQQRSAITNPQSAIPAAPWRGQETEVRPQGEVPQ